MDLCSPQPPRCAYCAHGSRLDDSSIMCPKDGVVPENHACKKFAYDPFKRVPPKPPMPRRDYTDEDFKID